MKRLLMREIRDVLRLSGEGLSTRKIGVNLTIGRTTVQAYLDRAAAIDLSWPLPLSVGLPITNNPKERWTMLTHPTLERKASLSLNGMAAAWRALAEQDPGEALNRNEWLGFAATIHRTRFGPYQVA